ncbi:NAD(P)-binding domain-containing protein [Priestia abyssalis]|uniref:NAD(P)-binding domain-containing protein n=1 Tax=Priestia abyssalis TaxID=1221450 RepID=UPI00099558A5|nr:FAD/NAD(P)-binding protein [Priestia abyssalis]
MYEWIIVGGGIQGVTMATFLLKQGKTSIDKLAIIDPHSEPLANWKHCTNIISMPYLRSPSVHHLDVESFGLQAFVKSSSHDWSTAFYGRYKRPSLQAFNDHCEHLIDDLLLHKAWIQGRVRKVNRMENGWSVELHNGHELRGKNLVLAIGISEQPSWPEWAEKLKQKSDSSVYHIFDTDLPDFGQLKYPFTIIGGGITSVHLAIKLSALFPKNVTLLKRHPFRLYDFDSDPAWLGPKNQQSFRKLASYKKRREQIIDARHKGSIPRDLHVKLLHQLQQGKLHIADGQVEQAEVSNGQIMLYDNQGSMFHQTGTVLLATGFKPTLPGKEWLTPMIHKHHLQCAECGYPIVSKSLQWGPDLYVTGALAELEMGPIARNISGARQAAERIVSSL